jgi:hypothetical protein
MKTRTVDNRNRPAQPEPGEDEAVQSPPVREQARQSFPDADRAVRNAEEKERKRQTGE